jgi:hypothetical protein
MDRDRGGGVSDLRSGPAPLLAFETATGRTMLYMLGRILQLSGLIIVPLAIAGEINHTLEFKDSLFWSAVGILVFIAGVLLQKLGKAP